jgi:Rrf2 family iron-sulfur cluster assembly transcriptional regulator
MRIKDKSRYAVLALAHMARNSADRPVALSEIAVDTEISHSYLEQIFKALRRDGLVKSVRGPGGGYVLGRAPEGIVISDIILAVDQPIRITRCEAGHSGCLGGGVRCLTHDLWEQLGHVIREFLGSVTLADVVNQTLKGGRVLS